MIRNRTVAYPHGLVVTEEHKRQMRGNKSCGWILMPPRDFLDLTTTSNEDKQAYFAREATVKDYNDAALDERNILPPFLYIELEKSPIGKVIGHEGRHRAAACIKENIKQMPVFLVAKFNGLAQWRLPEKEGSKIGDKGFKYRFIQATDFPKVAIAQYTTRRVPLAMATWRSLYHEDAE